VNIFACDVCGRTLRGGLAGFEVFASCEICEEFDVCLECCDSSTVLPGSKKSSKKKKGRVQGKEALKQDQPKVLRVAKHFKGKHTFKLIDRNLDEDDGEGGNDDDNRNQSTNEDSAGHATDKEDESMDDETGKDVEVVRTTSDGVIPSSQADGESLPSSSDVPPTEIKDDVTLAHSTANASSGPPINSSSNHLNDSSGISAFELLQRLAAAASAGEDTLPAFAPSSSRHLRWLVPHSSMIPASADSESTTSHSTRTVDSTKNTIDTSTSAFKSEDIQRGDLLQVSGASVNNSQRGAVSELEAALGLSLSEAAAVLSDGKMLVIGVRGEEKAVPKSGSAASGASEALTKQPPSLWFEGTIAFLRCDLTDDSSNHPVGGMGAGEYAKWVALGAVQSMDRCGPWGNTGFGLLADALAGELGRTNRRWRRKLQQSARAPGY